VRREYAGARGARFSISPGSALFRRQPDYVMSAELVETTRLWARVNARIDPRWAEEVGAHIVKRTYSEPRWSRRQGAAVASERVTLYGVPLVVDRTVQYGHVDPAAAREIFVRSALVEGDWDTQHAFWRANQALLDRVGELEERARRRDIVVEDEVLFAFYDQRVPPGIVSVRHFDRWWKDEHRSRPDLLTFTEDLLTSDAAGEVPANAYPTTWRHGDLELDLTYQFAPGSAADGVTVHVPVAVLNRVSAEGFDWQVPGLRDDLAVALLRSLPKALRRHFVPAPDHAVAALAAVRPGSGQFTDELARVLYERTGVRVPPGDWHPESVPDHLRVTFSVEVGGRVVASGKDLDALRDDSRGAVRTGMARAGASIERTGLTTWDVGTVPATFEGSAGGNVVRGFPALVDEGPSVALRLLPDEGEARAAHRLGVRRLLLLGTAPPWSRVLARLSNTDKLRLQQNPHGSVPALLQDCLAAAVDAVVTEHVPGEVRTQEAYAAALAAVRTHVVARVLQVVDAVLPVLAEAAQGRRRLDALAGSASATRLAATIADVRAQLGSLVGPGFVAATGQARLPDLLRYLRAISHRLDRAATNAREAALQEVVDGVEASYADLLGALSPGRRGAEQVLEVGWMIEELRVGLFAQGLGTAYPVSEKRVRRAIAALRP
jgi:ATP-dependent helicase HrpA